MCSVETLVHSRRIEALHTFSIQSETPDTKMRCVSGYNKVCSRLLLMKWRYEIENSTRRDTESLIEQSKANPSVM